MATCPCQPQSLLVLSTNIFPEHQGQGDKPGNTTWRCKSLFHSLTFKDGCSCWDLPAALWLCPWEQLCWAVQQAVPGSHCSLVWAQVGSSCKATCSSCTTSDPRCANCQWPHRWWCPGDCHLWNTTGRWTFLCRISYGSNFLVFPRHGYRLVVLIPANLWDVKSISAFILPQISARHECQYMNVLSHPTRPHTPDPLTICQVLLLGSFSIADVRRSSEWSPVSNTCTNYPSPLTGVLSLLFPTDTFPHNFTLLFPHFPLVSAKKNLFSFKYFLDFSLECLRVSLPLLIPFLTYPGFKSLNHYFTSFHSLGEKYIL